MGIQIRAVGHAFDEGFEGTRFAPVVICDHCGQQIANAKHGAYAWGLRLPAGEETTGLKFFHKIGDLYPECVAAWKQYENELHALGLAHQWESLDKFLVYLGNNLRKGTQEERR